MQRYDWEKLNSLQLGRYAEYLMKMEFTLNGFDVYTAEVDDKGIDFVLRKEHKDANGAAKIGYYDVQVKSVRARNYIFFRKDKFKPRHNLLAAICLFEDGELPTLYLIPAKEGTTPTPSLWIATMRA